MNEGRVTCSRWSQQHGEALHDRDKSNGAGEALISHQIHEAFKYQGENHPKPHTKKYCVDHQEGIAPHQRAQQMARSIKNHGKAEEVLNSRPDPLAVGYQAGAGSNKHVNKAHNGEQVGRRVLLNTLANSIGRQEHNGCIRSKDEHDISY